MNKLIISLAGFLLISAANAQKIHDPNAEVRETGSFHGIDISNDFDLFIDQSGKEAVAVSAATEKDREKIIVEVKNGILHIRMEKKGRWPSKDRKLKAYVSVKQIDELNISGSCDVTIQGTLKAATLRVDQSGASDLKGRIETDELSVDLSGASDISLSGKASRLHLDVSGASHFNGFGLETQTCRAEASGASEIKISVSRELSAEASGASDIRYRGEGKIVESRSSGAGSVTKEHSGS